MEEKESDIDILNQSLEALNIIIKEDFQDNEELFSKLIEVIQSKGKINEAFFIPVQER
jgi:mannitol/fructose-specific phosphotransferase system IIA component (Ntr-type)